jgi:hypothetical protein
MRIAVLGPLEVLSDAGVPVPVPGATERLLLAVLAAGVPDAVRTGRLLAVLPGDGGQEPAEETLRAHLRRLRGDLQPGLPERSSGQYVLRRGPGYVLAVGHSDIDATRFVHLVDRGRAELAAGSPAEAVRLLETALGLWRGEAFADWPDAPVLAAERRRLGELRAAAEAALGAARERAGEGSDRSLATPRERRSPVRPPAAAPRLPSRAVPQDPVPGPREVPRPAGPVVGTRRRWRTVLLTGGLVAALVAALVVAGLATRAQDGTRSDAPTAEPTTAAGEADRLAALSATEGPLDVSLLLAVQAARLSETPRARDRMLGALTALGRVERVVPLRGLPQDAVLSGGGRSLSVGIGNVVVAWPVGTSTSTRVLMAVPGEWGGWFVAAGSPTEDVVLAAGENFDGPWVRRVSATDGTSRPLLEGAQVGGTPVDGAVSRDGRRFLLLLADRAADPGLGTRWRLVDVAAADGARTDTGIEGVLPVPVDGLSADVADDARSAVVWDATGTSPAVLVEVTGGRRTPIAAHERPAATTAYRALPTGAAQLWDDGVVTLVDRAGRTVQELDAHQGQVREVVVGPHGTWAVTAGDDAGLVRWDVDPVTGTWSEPEALPGHTGGVVSVAVDATGGRMFTTALDQRVLVWDMSPYGGSRDDRVHRLPFMDTAAQLRELCAVVGRDLSRREWQRYLPDRPWQPTCTDLR